MHPDVTYTLYATYLREQTGNIIMSAHFQEGGLLSEICDNTESSDKSNDKYDDNSIIPPLII